MSENWPVLVPRPRQMIRHDGSFALGRRVRLEAPAEVPAATDRLVRALHEAGCLVDPAAAPCVELHLDPHIEQDEGYELHIADNRVALRARQEVGLYRAAATLAQLARCAPDGLPAVEIHDEPTLAVRGLMLDVSRNKVPSLETLEAIIDLAADLKLNQLQLYVEHTFAYHGHEVVWRDSGALTSEDFARLDRYCSRRFIRLVPNQNSFGHMHRWLRHDAYVHLAEVPEGVEHPFGDDVEPFSLCAVDPAVLAFLDDLYGQLLPAFGSSDELNVGLDETLDLGMGRSREACEERGRHRVYLDFLLHVHELAAARGRRMQYWGDIILEAPELIGDLPLDAIPLVWGYEQDHPFEDQAGRFAEAGLSFCLCPGTSSWNSLAGRLDNTRGNILAAAQAARTHGALGLLTTDWGDNGHLQPLPVSLPGYVLAAAWSWNPDDDTVAQDLAHVLNVHVFGDESGQTGLALCELADAYLACGAPMKNGTLLFRLLILGDKSCREGWFELIRGATFERASRRIRAARSALAGARPTKFGGSLVIEELSWVACLLEAACTLGAGLQLVGPEKRLRELPDEHRNRAASALRLALRVLPPVWVARNRSEGLEASAKYLTRTLTELEGG